MIKIERTDLFLKWLSGLENPDTIARIAARLDRMAMGHFGDCESVGGAVHELRFHFGPGYRIYFWKKGLAVILLLAGGDKGDQKKTIKLAKAIVAGLKASKRT